MLTILVTRSTDSTLTVVYHLKHPHREGSSPLRHCHRCSHWALQRPLYCHSLVWWWARRLLLLPYHYFLTASFGRCSVPSCTMRGPRPRLLLLDVTLLSRDLLRPLDLNANNPQTYWTRSCLVVITLRWVSSEYHWPVIAMWRRWSGRGEENGHGKLYRLIRQPKWARRDYRISTMRLLKINERWLSFAFPSVM